MVFRWQLCSDFFVGCRWFVLQIFFNIFFFYYPELWGLLNPVLEGTELWFDGFYGFFVREDRLEGC